VRAPSVVRLQTALTGQGIPSTVLDGNELLVEGASSARVGEIAFDAGVLLHELVPESSSLEDVFLELTAEVPS
jgi:ABC-2 type transport system ATP-binding protein